MIEEQQEGIHDKMVENELDVEVKVKGSCEEVDIIA